MQSHEAAVFSVAVSPSGAQLASASEDHSIRIWDAATGNQVNELGGHSRGVFCVSYSPDGQYLASASADGSIRVWSTDSYQELNEIKVGSSFSEVRYVNWSPDSRRLVGGGEDDAVFIWEALSGKELMRFTGHTKTVRCCCFSPDGKYVASTSNDETSRIWDAVTGREVVEPLRHNGRATSCAWSPDGNIIASGDGNGNVTLWKLDGTIVHRLQGQTAMKCVAFSGDSQLVLGSSQDNTIKIYKVSDGTPVTVLKGHTDWVNTAVFSPDSTNIIYSGSDDLTIRAWNVATSTQISRFLFRSKAKQASGQTHDGAVWGAVFSTDGDFLATCSADHTARIWDSATGEQVQQLTGHEDEVTSISYAQNGETVVTGSDDKTVRIWEAFSGKQICKVTLPAKVACVRVAPQDSNLVLVAHGSQAAIIDVAQQKVTTRFTAHTAVVRCCDWSPDCKRILTGSNDKLAIIFDVETQNVLVRYDQTEGRVVCCQWSKSPDVVATGGGDRKVRVWNAINGTTMYVLEGHSSALKCIDYSFDGSRMVTSSEDKTLRVWELSKKTCLAVLEGHQGYVTACSFNADASKILSASKDRTACVWHADRGSRLLTLRSKWSSRLPTSRFMTMSCGAVILSVAFSNNGKVIAAGDENGQIRIFDSKTGELLKQIDDNSGADMWSVQFTTNDEEVLTSTSHGKVRIYNVTSGELAQSITASNECMRCAAFNSDNTKIVTGGDSKEAAVYLRSTGERICAFTKHRQTVRSARFSPDGRWCVTASNDGTARVWSAATGEEISVFEAPGRMVCVAYSHDGTRVCAGGGDGFVRIFDPETGSMVVDLIGHLQAIKCTAWTKDDARVITSSEDNSVRVWDAPTGAELLKLTGHADWVYGCDFSPLGTQIVSGSKDKTVCLWNIASGEQVYSFETMNRRSAERCAFSPDSSMILAVDGHRVYVYNATTGEHMVVIDPTRRGTMMACAFSHNGKLIAAAANSTFWVWDISSPSQPKLVFHTNMENTVRDLHFAHDNRRILATSNDKSGRVYDIYATADNCVTTYRKHNARVVCGKFSPDDRVVATGGGDRAVHVWYPHDGESVSSLVGHSSAVKALDWSKDGSLLVTSSEDKSVRIWDVKAEKELVCLNDHNAYVISVTFSHDDKQVLSASKDNTIILWDVQTRSKVLKFHHEKGSKLTDAAFSPDSTKVVSTADDGRLHIWDTDTDFAIWMGVQAFLALQRGQGRERGPATKALLSFRDRNPLCFGRHSKTKPSTLLSYIVEHTSQREDVDAAVQGLLGDYCKPINLYPEDGETVLERAISQRSRLCTVLLLQNLKYHPVSESRWAWTRALPLLAEAFPDLVTPMLREAIVVSPMQVCRSAELEPDQFIVAGSQTEDPPVEFSALDSYKGVPVRSYVIGLPHLLDYRKWEEAGSDPISVLASRSISSVFELPSVRAALRFRWHSFSERYFNSELKFYLLFLALLSINVLSIAKVDFHQSLFQTYFSGMLSLIRLALLISLVAVNVLCVKHTFKRACVLKSAFFSSFWNRAEILAHGSVFWFLLAHILGLEAQFSIASIAVILSFLRIFSFARGVSTTGVQLRLVQRVLIQATPFLYIASALVIGLFSGFLWSYSSPADEQSSQTLFQQLLGPVSLETNDGAFQSLYTLQLAYILLFPLGLGVILMGLLFSLVSGDTLELKKAAFTEWCMERGSLIMDIEAGHLEKEHREVAQNSPIWLHVLVPIHAGKEGFLAGQLGDKEAGVGDPISTIVGSEAAAQPSQPLIPSGTSLDAAGLEQVMRTLLSRERARSQEDISEVRKAVVKEVGTLLEKSLAQQLLLLSSKVDGRRDGLVSGVGQAASGMKTSLSSASAVPAPLPTLSGDLLGPLSGQQLPVFGGGAAAPAGALDIPAIFPPGPPNHPDTDS